MLSVAARSAGPAAARADIFTPAYAVAATATATADALTAADAALTLADPGAAPGLVDGQILTLVDQLMIGNAALVPACALLLHFGLCPLVLGFGFGHACLLLGHLGALAARFGLLARLGDRTLTALLEFAFTGPLLGPRS